MFPVESLIKLQNLGIWVSCQLPDDQLKPVPAWSSTCLDLFGPFETRGETNKQIRGKAYGVIFSWMLTRATHIDLATDYSTDAFLQVLCRFMAIRGSLLYYVLIQDLNLLVLTKN